MLEALENGVKGGMWFSLIDKVHKPANLWSAWCKAAKNQGSAGVDRITIEQFEREAEANVEYLCEQLRQGTYQPKPILLGYRFDRGRRWPRDKSMAKLREAIRVKTRRTEGRALPVIIQDVNRTMRGWFGYFKHSSRTVFPDVDGWVRGRLRSLLRKRQKRRGKAKGADHQRWPNAFFAQLGFYSLVEARARLPQSAKAAH
jgi:hypothetical protein